MDNELMRLRQVVYDTGARYRRAVSERLQIMYKPANGSAREVMRQLDSTAEEFRKAIRSLSEYLDSVETSREREKERLRIKVVSESFERDLNLIH
jgi:intergrase/recombinase